MEPSSVGASPILEQTSFADILAPTFSPASEAGTTRSSLPAGPKIGPSGRDPAHASRSVPRAEGLAQTTLDTFGQSSPASLASAALQCALESRLRHELAEIGSRVFALTWRRWDMRSGPPICALRASVLPTSDSESIGWATPLTRDYRDTGDLSGSMVRASGKSRDDTLPRQEFLAGWATPTVADSKNAQSKTTDFQQLAKTAHLAGWPTPTAIEQLDTPEKKAARGSHVGLTLSVAAKFAGWPTPCTADDRNRGTDSPAIQRRAELGKQLNLSMVAGLSGIPASGTGAATERKGSLNPAFSRWLMGYPAAWGSCAATATQSSRKSRRSS